ncbi:HNH endonuclease [Mucilaginibacter sp.]|uniref:HNH endonuclease n=1 Tax=Mucilaginibacter sp. TaxID=1882438 RepID=UPI003AFFCEFB
MLLSVLQAFSQKLYLSSKIYITPELVALFKTNWSLLVTSNHDCNFALPFYHLTSDKFWFLQAKPGFESFLQIKTSMRSFSNLNAAVDYAFVEDDLFKLITNEKDNVVLLLFLLDEYFPETKNNFANSIPDQQKLLNNLENKILKEDAVEYRTEIRKLIQQKDEEEIFLRGSLFKREIPKIYNNTCCISGMRIDSTINVSMIDACHIVPFSESYADTISNGIALCPNLHRAFDRGLISIGDNYEVIVKDTFSEELSTNYFILPFHGKQINLPNKIEDFPSSENLSYHRKKFNF